MTEGTPNKGAERQVLERFGGSWNLTGKLCGEDLADEPMTVEGWWGLDLLRDSSSLIIKSEGRVGSAHSSGRPSLVTTPRRTQVPGGGGERRARLAGNGPSCGRLR
jgi:hypothetical protein